MSYIKITNGVQQTYTIGQLRKDNPNTSFPKNIPESILKDYGVYPVVVGNKPSFDEVYQKLELNTEATLVNNVWTYEWSVKNKTAEELATYVENLKGEVRSKRNQLLQACDWTQLADASVDSLAWANYRQALRDVPQQAGFPTNVTWPTEPA